MRVGSFRHLFSKYRNFVFDMDGVLWEGNTPFLSAVDTLAQLHANQKNVFFLTNNSTRTVQTLHKKLLDLGFSNSKLKNLYSTNLVSSKYLKQSYRHTFMIGNLQMKTQMQRAGLTVFWANRFDEQRKSQLSPLQYHTFQNIFLPNHIDSVLVGYDSQFNFMKVCYAAILVQRGLPFYTTNPDKFTYVNNIKKPGTATMTVPIETVCGVKAKVLGKPSKTALEIIIDQNKLDKKQTLMVGDNIETDIECGINAGIDTALVLSGVTRTTQGWSSPPTFVLQRV